MCTTPDLQPVNAMKKNRQANHRHARPDMDPPGIVSEAEKREMRQSHNEAASIGKNRVLVKVHAPIDMVSGLRRNLAKRKTLTFESGGGQGQVRPSSALPSQLLSRPSQISAKPGCTTLSRSLQSPSSRSTPSASQS